MEERDSERENSPVKKKRVDPTSTKDQREETKWEKYKKVPDHQQCNDWGSYDHIYLLSKTINSVAQRKAWKATTIREGVNEIGHIVLNTTLNLYRDGLQEVGEVERFEAALTKDEIAYYESVKDVGSSTSDLGPSMSWDDIGHPHTYLATKSESVVEIYKKDLEEFRSGLKNEYAILRDVASHTIHDLPTSFEASVAVD
ncbi:hypothetical protein NC652_040921 [Populus alba x Populus x berolinensis]|nr:hypothetical protein NC652_040921 [Populus alba x Populus x berolinensis]